MKENENTKRKQREISKESKTIWSLEEQEGCAKLQLGACKLTIINQMHSACAAFLSPAFIRSFALSTKLFYCFTK